ncbi:MAG: serine hydrolase domain-containing protein [Flavobacteriales bacterium]
MLKKIGLGFMFLLLALLLTVYLTGNEHMLRGLRSTYFIGKSKPDIDDMKWFDLSVMKHDSIDSSFPTAKAYGMLQLTPEEEAVHAQFESTAFLVFKRDTLIFEKYFGDGGVDVVSNSFSMAKSYTAILIGVAIDEGLIKSVDQPVSDFLPEFKEGENAKLTIKHLLQMASGIPFGESYASPFGYMAKAYFGKNLQEATAHFRVKTEPGTGWAYEGGNTVLLGEILMKATGKSVSQYFEEKIWSKIDTGHDAYWNLDRQGGMEKVFSGF